MQGTFEAMHEKGCGFFVMDFLMTLQSGLTAPQPEGGMLAGKGLPVTAKKISVNLKPIIFPAKRR